MEADWMDDGCVEEGFGGESAWAEGMRDMVRPANMTRGARRRSRDRGIVRDDEEWDRAGLTYRIFQEPA